MLGWFTYDIGRVALERDRWADIERGLRVLKPEIEIAPIFYRKPERIKAHTRHGKSLFHYGLDHLYGFSIVDF
ncbi:hypothetical protein [Leucothrix pacifica]|uniref:Uncharacterized protein n=1 Tax=Leucothrix pacifica TaxID=1247513 RepID=A0A317CG64_9GAMM|nr:hypothetical protein [Leucothrix pacifica]PWQ97377.1 hypothetical protein DKW60_10465 [Leucothrix pacifica]